MSRTSRRRRFSPSLQTQGLESRQLLTGGPLPALLVVANQQHFYYQEYGDTRAALEAAGLSVVVAATTTDPTVPHANTGEGPDGGVVVPDLALADVAPDDYSAIAFVGGWGASMYQYAFNDPDLDGDTDNFYDDPFYNGDDQLNDGAIAPQKVVVNDLINAFLAADKPVGGLCHGVTVLAWSRDGAGESPLAGRNVAVPLTVGSPAQFYDGEWRGGGDLMGQYDQVIANGGNALPVPGQYGDPTTAADDVLVDGRIVTGENYDSALHFGAVLAQEVWASQAPDENQPPVANGASFTTTENALAGTFVGQVVASDPDPGQSLTYAIVAGNPGGAFAIDPATGTLTVAVPGALDFESGPVLELTVQATDDGAPGLSALAQVVVDLTDVYEPVSVIGDYVVVQGTSGLDKVRVWSVGRGENVSVWINGATFGPFLLPGGGHVVVDAGAGNDQVDAAKLNVPAIVLGGPGRDKIVGGTNRDMIVGGTGADTVQGGAGEDLLIGGATCYDGDVEALRDVLATWTAGLDFRTRVALLSDPTAPRRLRLGETVHDDAAPNALDGGAGANWLLS